jgi:hypothetical protein
VYAVVVSREQEDGDVPPQPILQKDWAMNTKWKHTHPYPTNPFERVSGKELEKLHKLTQKKPIYEEALL